jgi:hypothetical protein
LTVRRPRQWAALLRAQQPEGCCGSNPDAGVLLAAHCGVEGALAR